MKNEKNSNNKPDLKRLVGEAIGEASMCWTERPAGVFESSRAKGIAESLIRAIESELAAARAEISELKELVKHWNFKYAEQVSFADHYKTELDAKRAEIDELKSNYYYRKAKGAETVSDEKKNIYKMLEQRDAVIAEMKKALEYYQSGSVLYIDGTVNTTKATEALSNAAKIMANEKEGAK